VVLRLGVFLCVIAGLGSRQASWLMQVLFRVTVSKSAIDRWIDEVADGLASEDETIKLPHQQKPITQGRFDEVFPLGTQSCVVVLKDEHGRIVTAQEVKKRDAEHGDGPVLVDTSVALLLRPFLINCQKIHTAPIQIAVQLELDK
jgi:hypothetical protein